MFTLMKYMYESTVKHALYPCTLTLSVPVADGWAHPSQSTHLSAHSSEKTFTSVIQSVMPFTWWPYGDGGTERVKVHLHVDIPVDIYESTS
jgi:hypothetical protein